MRIPNAKQLAERNESLARENGVLVEAINAISNGESIHIMTR